MRSRTVVLVELLNVGEARPAGGSKARKGSVRVLLLWEGGLDAVVWTWGLGGVAVRVTMLGGATRLAGLEGRPAWVVSRDATEV